MIVPRFTPEQCLILTDADIESLIATAMASEQQSINSLDPSILAPAWWAKNSDELDLVLPVLESAARSQAEIYALHVLPDHAFYPPDSNESAQITTSVQQSRILLDAAYLAMQLGLKRVVWPIRIPESHPNRIAAIGEAIDRAMLISRLVSIDANTETAPELLIETPFVDLSDDQIADLAQDIAIPIDTCWWADAGDITIAQQRAEAWKSIDPRQSAMLEPKPGVRTTI